MKKAKLFWLSLLFIAFIPLSQSYAQPFNYERIWATYFGDENLTIADNALDKYGNIYFVGRVNDDGFFPATNDSHQPLYGGGTSDGFIVKMNPEGQLIWATFYGGEMSEYISGIAIDENDDIYIIGATSSTSGIATPNSYQPQIDGVSDIFVAQFSPGGERIWATYYPSTDSSTQDFSGMGISSHGESIVADGTGAIYFVNRTDKLDAATTGTFQMEIGQASNTLVSKFSTDGERIWATYYGINFSNVYSVALGSDGLYLGGVTFDCPPSGSYNTYFGTVGSHQPEPGSCKDVFVSKFSVEGNRLWTTYYGNNYPESMVKNAIVCFGENIYFSGISYTSTNITTPGSYQEGAPSNENSSYLIKFNSAGERQWGTFFGLDPDLSALDITPYARLGKDSQGNIYMLGNTKFQANISTDGAFQEEKALKNDNYLAIFHPSGQLLYGTYYGGDGEEYGSSPLVYGHTVFMFGQTSSTEGIATAGSYQPDYMQSADPDLETNIYIAKFTPEGMGLDDLDTQSFTVYPNPNNGSFTIMAKEGIISSVEVYNTLGQRMEKTWTALRTNEVQVQGLGSGLYFVRVVLDNARIGTVKVVVK